jgi:ketosteroid isomerase-like protein
LTEPASANAATITRFYRAFQNRDAAAMLACYHADVTFEDPAFGKLDSTQARAMWKMLIERGADLRITFDSVHATGDGGGAHWEAFYTFSRSKRKVHNIIDADFQFRDGLIIAHRDRFNFWRWSAQALGISGLLLGWLPPFHRKVTETSRATLQKYMQKTGS